MPITLHAWHPLFTEAKMELRVETNSRREVRIVVTPAPPRVPRAPTPPPAPPGPNDIVIE
jgi:hypothetical protein